jgi:hypothetical protein
VFGSVRREVAPQSLVHLLRNEIVLIAREDPAAKVAREGGRVQRASHRGPPAVAASTTLGSVGERVFGPFTAFMGIQNAAAKSSGCS